MELRMRYYTVSKCEGRKISFRSDESIYCSRRAKVLRRDESREIAPTGDLSSFRAYLFFLSHKNREMPK